jgi:uncharacterized protein YbaP (TraB family)
MAIDAQYAKIIVGKKILKSFTIKYGIKIFVDMRNLRKYCFLLIILISGLQAFSQGKSILWEISGNGLTDTSYLFGTIHIRDKRVFNLGDSTYYAINRTSALYGELDLQDKEAIKKLVPEIMMPNDTTLELLISATDYDQVKAYCKKNIGMYALLINKIRPMYISTMVTEHLLPSQEKKPLDMYLQTYAVKKKKEVGGIETYEEQIAVMNMIGLKEQADMLVDQIQHIDEEKVLLDKMLQLYLDEDLTKLDVLLKQDTSMTTAFNEAMFDKRNIVMLERMRANMNRYSCFFAVGAGHLCGDKGLIVLLKKAGYTVRPVKRK